MLNPLWRISLLSEMWKLTMKCRKCGRTFAKKAMKISGVKGKCKYFARY